MRTRRETVEHPFGTIKNADGGNALLVQHAAEVAAEMTYNLTRMLNIVGVANLVEAIKA